MSGQNISKFAGSTCQSFGTLPTIGMSGMLLVMPKNDWWGEGGGGRWRGSGGGRGGREVAGVLVGGEGGEGGGGGSGGERGGEGGGGVLSQRSAAFYRAGFI